VIAVSGIGEGHAITRRALRLLGVPIMINEGGEEERQRSSAVEQQFRNSMPKCQTVILHTK